MPNMTIFASEYVPAGSFVAIDARGHIRVATGLDDVIGIAQRAYVPGDEYDIPTHERTAKAIHAASDTLARRAPVSTEEADRIMTTIVHLIANGVDPTDIEGILRSAYHRRKGRFAP